MQSNQSTMFDSSAVRGLSGTKAAAVAPAIMAAFLGVFMIWGVGFSHISQVHNAAHDVRHSSAFPCH